MGLPVLTHQASPVNAEDHGKSGQTHIVDDLIKGPLEKGRINGHHRPEPLCGKTCRKSHGVLFRNAHVHKPFRKDLGEAVEARSLGHCRRNGKELFLPLPQFHHGLAEDLGVGGRFRGRGLFGRTGGNLKASHAVIVSRVFLCGCVALPFHGEHVHQDGPLQMIHVLEGFDQAIQAVSLDGAHILELESFEEHAGGEKGKKRIFASPEKGEDVFAHAGNRFEEIFKLFPEVDKPSARHPPAQERREGTHIGRDGHGVVVENDDEVLLCVPSLIQPFESHSRRCGPIPDHRDDL